MEEETEHVLSARDALRLTRIWTSIYKNHIKMHRINSGHRLLTSLSALNLCADFQRIIEPNSLKAGKL